MAKRAQPKSKEEAPKRKKVGPGGGVGRVGGNHYDTISLTVTAIMLVDDGWKRYFIMSCVQGRC